jgi:hypothetical protein
MLYILGTLVPLCFHFISCRVFSVSSSMSASAASAFVVFATAERRKSKKAAADSYTAAECGRAIVFVSARSRWNFHC